MYYKIKIFPLNLQQILTKRKLSVNIGAEAMIMLKGNLYYAKGKRKKGVALRKC